jgi:hypothetical protein
MIDNLLTAIETECKKQINTILYKLDVLPCHETKTTGPSKKMIDNFLLPITYLDKSQIFLLSDTVSTDLELTSSQNTKSMYEYLFNPTHSFAKDLIPEWKKQYTNNAEFLNDTKYVLTSMNVYREKMSQSVDPIYDTSFKCLSVDCDRLGEIWKETKENPDFLSKYTFMEWTMLKGLNESSGFLQVLSFLNVASPALSLCIPFFFLLFPFLILNIQGIPVTFEMYFNVLKTIAKNHFIGKTLSSLSSMSPDKIAYLVITFALYILQIYQNMVQCHRFYTNMKQINGYLCDMRDFVYYSIRSMENFISINSHRLSYRPFLHNMRTHCHRLTRLRDELQNIQPFSNTFTKFGEMGYLLKCFYKLHANVEYHESLQYSFGFEGYVNNLLGVYTNLENGHVSFAEFDISGNCRIEKQYYPPLVGTGVVKNNCSFEKNIIISSPNAGGKTTMIKTTTINIIFSQQVGCGFYTKCVMQPYTHIHSYLNIPDTSGRDSLFQAESRRCKEIIDVIHSNQDPEKYRHFCIFDELYSGTNPVEATKSAYAFLLYLSKFSNVHFILTTHYITICKKFRKSLQIQNYKMDVENLDDGGLKYTYKMKKGISKIEGAVKILEQMEYPGEILDIIRNFTR